MKSFHTFRVSALFSAFLLLSLIPVVFADPVPGMKEETQATFEKRFAPVANFDPEFYPIPQGGQACIAKRVSKPDDAEMVVECEFTASTNEPEYLSIGTPYFIKKPGYVAAVDALVEELDEKTGQFHEVKFPINLRFVDPSGEWHQVRANDPIGKWMAGPVESSRDTHWGGDDDGTLQFPCSLEFIVVDHPAPNIPRKVRVTFRGVKFFRKNTIEPVITLTEQGPAVHLAQEAPATGLPTHVYRVGNVPKGMIFEAKLTPEFLQKFEGKTDQLPEITLEVSASQDQPATKIPLVLKKDGTASFSLPLSQKVGFQALILTPKYADPETGEVQMGQPVKFAYSVLPKESRFDDWLGICTHYAQGWNLETQKFLPPAGIRFFRDEMGWGRCEREKGKYEFDPYWDQYVNEAREKGLEPLLILDYANGHYDGGDFPHSDEAVQGFANYCRAIAEHFKGRIKYYEIWNEWTGGCGMGNFRDQKNNSPENYVKLVAAASKALREADPDCFIIGGGGDHHTYHFWAIEAQMKLGVMKYCDAFSVHPYEYSRSPEEAKMVENLQKVLDCMKANGCAEPKLWLTELGWPTHDGVNGFPQKDAAVREALEAQMFVRAALTCRSILGVQKFLWYDLKNDGTDPTYNENNFGIIHHDSYQFQPKAAFQASAILSGFTSGAVVKRSKKYFTDDLAVYEIQRPDSPVVYAAWSLSKENAAVKIPFTFKKAVGLYGEKLDGVTEVKNEPIYFE